MIWTLCIFKVHRSELPLKGILREWSLMSLQSLILFVSGMNKTTIQILLLEKKQTNNKKQVNPKLDRFFFIVTTSSSIISNDWALKETRIQENINSQSDFQLRNKQAATGSRVCQGADWLLAFGRPSSCLTRSYHLGVTQIFAAFNGLSVA